MEKEREWPIIVGGFYRSGTSLVRRMLDSHSQVFCGPEVKFWRDFYGDYRDDPFSHIRFFSTVRTLGVDEEQLQQHFAEAYTKLLQDCAKAREKHRWADKNPENLLYLEQWHKVLKGEFYFLFVVRNPLDALASLKEVGFEKTLPPDFQWRVNECERFLNAGLEYQAKFSDRSVLLCYEDLVVEPERVLTKTLSPMGLDFESSMLTEFMSGARGQGIEDPKVANTDSVHASSVSRWRADLEPEESQLAITQLGPIMAKLGYAAES